MKPLLSLVMIVKDEEARIAETLESVKPFIDRYTILDTGSTDRTKEIIRETMAGVPGSLCDGSFVDFATTRNAAFDAEEASDNPAKYQLVLSGDETLSGGANLREFLETYEGRHTTFKTWVRSGDALFPASRVRKCGSPFRYEGVVHEDLINRSNNGEEKFVVSLIQGVTIEHRPSDPERRARRIRQFDLPALEKVLEDATSDADERRRAVLYLAQTHEGLADSYDRNVPGSAWLSHEITAMGYYMRSAEIGGVSEEGALAMFRYLNCAIAAAIYTDEEVIPRLAACVQTDPRRPEPRFLLAAHVARKDPKAGLKYAIEAAECAAEAQNATGGLVFHVSTVWKSWHLACACAKAVGDSHVAEYANKGIEAGGPIEYFEQYL